MILTILFESPFWIGVLEDERDGNLYAARYVFGAEPSNEIVYEFVQTEMTALMRQMTVGVPVESTPQRRINPKRLQRQIRRELAQEGISTKAQDAMRLHYEQHKKTRQDENRQERDAERAHKHSVKREKARAKHKGH